MVFRCNGEELKRVMAGLLDDYGLKRPVEPKLLAERVGIELVPLSTLDEEAQGVVRGLVPYAFGVETDDGKCSLVYDDKVTGEEGKLRLLEWIGHVIFDHSRFDETEISQAKYFARYCTSGGREETG